MIKDIIMTVSFIFTDLMNSREGVGLVEACIGVNRQVMNPQTTLQLIEMGLGKNKREPSNIPDDNRSKLSIKHSR